MRLSDLMGKWMKGEQLSVYEQQEALLQLRRLEDTSTALGGTILPGTLRQSFLSPTIEDVLWNSSPLHAYTMYRREDVIVPDSTDYFIEHDEARSFGGVFETYIEDANGTRIKLLKNEYKFVPFTVNGFTIWEGNETGYRVLYIESYDRDDNFLARTPLLTIKGFSEIDNVIPFSLTWFYAVDTNYVKFKVHQTSGGDLTLKEFYAGFTLA